MAQVWCDVVIKGEFTSLAPSASGVTWVTQTLCGYLSYYMNSSRDQNINLNMRDRIIRL